MSEAPIDPLLVQRPTLNPYLTAASLIYHRLLWDIQPLAWHSRKVLNDCRDSHAGKNAVIMCNGPSLLKADFDLLKTKYTFGLNKINLLKETVDFTPSCVVAVNGLVLEQNRDFFNETSLPLFLDAHGMRNANINARPNVVGLHSTNIKRFAQDCSMSIFQGHTVTFVAMQLAFHMGFFKVALVGCDHYFSTQGPANATVTSDSDDPNHFHKDYFGRGVKWQLPDILESEVGYTMAKNNFDAHGRQIFNCTEGGALEIFERCSLQEFLEDQ